MYSLQDIPVTTLLKNFREGTLVVPEYQRNEVWSKQAQSYLIDTILKGYIIPPLMIVREYNDEGETLEELADGQQRFTAIRLFSEKELRLSGPLIDKKYKGKSYDTLDESERKKFQSCKIPVIYIEGMNEASKRELFKRFNEVSITLNKTEMRNAQYLASEKKEVYDLAEEYKKTILDSKILTQENIKRMKHIDLMAQIFTSVCFSKIGFNQHDVDKFYQEKTSFLVSKDLAKRRILEMLEFIFSEMNEVTSSNLLKSYNFISLLQALYINKWGELDSKEIKYNAEGVFSKDTTAASQNILLLLENRKKRKLEGSSSEFVKASMKTTDSKEHRQIRAKWLLKALQNKM